MSTRACVLVALAAVCACEREPLEVAPSVDLAQFQGKWHEVAHLARPTQNDCVGTTATYSRNADGTFSFLHECTVAGGKYKGSKAIARLSDSTAPAKMEVDFGGYKGDYWIVEVAPDYRYAVVGHPSRDYLWILSRTPTMDRADLDAVLAHASAKSFDTSKLEYTPQGPEPQGTPTPPVTYGCAFAFGPDCSWGAGLLAIGLLVAARRRMSRLKATSRE